MLTRSKFIGAIIGTAIGDALGAPMETMWAKDIAEKFPHFTADSVDYVESLVSEERGSGKWTDDTQLMIPTATSIIKHKAIIPSEMARSYAHVYLTERHKGWGRSTTESLQRVAEGVPWEKAADGSLGTGNGPAMKAAPLGLYFAAALARDDYNDIRAALVDIIDVGRITHHNFGVRSGLLQSVMVGLAVHDCKPNFIMDAIQHCELAFFNSDVFSQKVMGLVSLDSIPDICAAGGVTSKADESWCSTAAVYLKYCEEMSDCMPALVELIQQGGDTDTTGAMLGALIGARHGEGVFPIRLRTRLKDFDNIAALGAQLFEALGCNELTNKQYQFSFVKLT